MIDTVIKTGGDPRTLADYASLRDELAKLTHPARPDVNWKFAQKCCLSLFEHNGVELQTSAWYTLSRTHLAGLYGLNEGLVVMEALITYQWGNLWPQPVHARMEILSSLSQRLQQVLRTMTFSYADLSQLYCAEQHLTSVGAVLQRLELKHLSQFETLRTQLHNAAVRLENCDDGATATGGVTLASCAVSASNGEANVTPLTMPAAGVNQWIYVAQPEPQPAITESTTPAPLWQPFVAGMLTMLAVSSAAYWGWQTLYRPDPLLAQLNASLTPQETLSASQARALKTNVLPASDGILRTRQQLKRLGALPPDSTLRYGNELVQQAQRLWPDRAQPLAQQWQTQLKTAALPEVHLTGWHQGMMQLQRLTDRLNALDERRGSYITGSELKTMVFAITQSFNRAVPAEEQLRQLTLLPENEPVPAALQSQAEQHLKQLIARYALIASHTQE